MLKNTLQQLFSFHCDDRYFSRWPTKRPQQCIRILLQCICLTLLLASSGPLFAHAVVTESSLRAHPVQPRTKTSVLLTFNSGIELALSQVFLVSKGDIHQPVTVKQGRKPGQIIVELPSLDPGEYALRYKVFAADGHLTEDVIHFSVSEPEGD
jgi:copper resistance protein C